MFSKTNRDHFFYGLYGNTPESLGELSKAVEYSPAARVPKAFIVLSESTRSSAVTR